MKPSLRQGKEFLVMSGKIKRFENKVAIVTGASSGIGLVTAKMLACLGAKVYGIARNNFSTDDFKFLQCDVTDSKQVIDAVKSVFESEGKIDFLVNCAGIGISGSVENSEDSQIDKIFDVNFFGTVKMCKAVLPYMRSGKFGKIVNISSVAGELPIPFQTFYSATKAGIQSFTAGLDMEVRPFGIRATCVLPGDTKTGFTAAREKNVADDKSYGNRIKTSIGKMEHDEQNGMSPESVAKVITKVLSKNNPKPINIVGFKYKFLVALSKCLPKKLVHKILFKMYAK